MGLQLTNILRDVAEDLERDRVYLPQDELARFGVTEAHIAEARCDDALRFPIGDSFSDLLDLLPVQKLAMRLVLRSIELVAGFEQPTSGTVSVNARPVSGPGPDRAVVFQHFALFPWKTVRQNILFAMRTGTGAALTDVTLNVCDDDKLPSLAVA